MSAHIAINLEIVTMPGLPHTLENLEKSGEGAWMDRGYGKTGNYVLEKLH